MPKLRSLDGMLIEVPPPSVLASLRRYYPVQYVRLLSLLRGISAPTPSPSDQRK